MTIPKLYSFLREAISDHSANFGAGTSSDWLQDYLGRKLSDKSVDTIHAISGEILETLEPREGLNSFLIEVLKWQRKSDSR